MKFMTGKAPIRRTLNYLNNGKLYLRDQIKILSLNYNPKSDHHHGASEFVFWYFPQIQYKNPNVQLITFQNMTPSPFIRCFYNDGRDLVIDIDSRTKEEILNHCFQVIGKTPEELKIQEERVAVQKHMKENPANFGVGCSRPCICVIPGQLPCPGAVTLPDHMRGKYTISKK